MSVGVPPQTPLGNLQRSPRLSIAGFKGLTAKGRKDGKERERENFICHSNEQEYHTVVTIQQNISTHVWQA